MISCMSEQNDQEYIATQIALTEPCFIGRIAGVELLIAYQLQTHYPQAHLIQELENNAGIYVKDTTSLLLYADMLIRSYDSCTAIAEWTGKVQEITGKGQEFIQKRTPTIKKIDALSLEPYYFADSWMPAMKGKRVLIIHPFVTTIQSQLSHLAELFPGQSWFEGCTFQFAKPPVTLAGNHQGIDWKVQYDTFIDQLNSMQEYDIALVAAGGYGMLIAAHVFSQKKQVLYIGGALQIFFGIIGKRWFDNKEVLKQMNDSWVRPNKERPANSTRVEKGCYW